MNKDKASPIQTDEEKRKSTGGFASNLNRNRSISPAATTSTSGHFGYKQMQSAPEKAISEAKSTNQLGTSSLKVTSGAALVGATVIQS